jgi:hypothetical protein
VEVKLPKLAVIVNEVIAALLAHSAAKIYMFAAPELFSSAESLKILLLLDAA